MKTKSELRLEVLELLCQIDDELADLNRRVTALEALRNKGAQMMDRVGIDRADRDTIESVGAWMDETKQDG